VNSILGSGSLRAAFARIAAAVGREPMGACCLGGRRHGSSVSCYAKSRRKSLAPAEPTSTMRKTVGRLAGVQVGGEYAHTALTLCAAREPLSSSSRAVIPRRATRPAYSDQRLVELLGS